MPQMAHCAESCEPTIALMMAEHERLAALYLHNAQMGEQRTSLYLTVISADLAALLALVQLGAAFPLWTTVGMWAGLQLFGLVVFSASSSAACAAQSTCGLPIASIATLPSATPAWGRTTMSAAFYGVQNARAATTYASPATRR
jgi:hypothetical protein